MADGSQNKLLMELGRIHKNIYAEIFLESAERNLSLTLQISLFLSAGYKFGFRCRL